VVDIDAYAVRGFAPAVTTGPLIGPERASSLCLPFWAVEDVIGSPDTLRDAGTASTTFDVALYLGAAVGAKTRRLLECATACHAGCLVFRQHNLAALNARRARRSLSLTSKRVRTPPAPYGFTITRRDLALGAQLDRTSPAFGGACRASRGSQLYRRSAVSALLSRKRLTRDLARLAARGIARDGDQAIGAEPLTHRTDMIPDWRIR
jgi:hypothetical protein